VLGLRKGFEASTKLVVRWRHQCAPFVIRKTHGSRRAAGVLIVRCQARWGLALHIGQTGSAIFHDRPSKTSHETRYSTGDLQAGQQAIRFAVSAESRNLIIAAWNDSGVCKVRPLFGEAQETAAHGSHRGKV
jgi:hypothetical protein